MLQCLKKIHQRANHQTHGCIILAQTGSELPFPPEEIILEKLTNIALTNYCILTCFIISKESLESTS